MTTQQGQQMIVTQVPRQHHVIVNQHSGNGNYLISFKWLLKKENSFELPIKCAKNVMH